jgi:hypothetical protein
LRETRQLHALGDKRLDGPQDTWQNGLGSNRKSVRAKTSKRKILPEKKYEKKENLAFFF